MRRAEASIITAATIAVIVAGALAIHFSRAPNENPLLTDHDIPHYTTILAGADDGVSFARDPIYSRRLTLVWRAASAYMGLFRAAYLAAGRDWALTIALFQLVLLAVYFPCMVLFLRSVGTSLPVALAVAAVSTVSSSFLVTGTRWGILTPPVPLVMCTALAPLIAWAALRLPPKLAMVTGTLLCVPMVLVNPATGMALVELGLILAFLATIRGRLSWGAFVALVITAVVWTIVTRRNISAGTAAFSFTDAAELIRYGQENVMVFPFRGLSVSRAIGAVLAAHAALTIVLFPFRSRRAVLAALIVVQAAYAAFFLHAGWLMVLPLAVALENIRRDRFEAIDRWLWCALGVAMAIGPLQQVALLEVWRRTQMTALTAVVFDGARFVQFSYLIAFALVARSIEVIQRSFAAAWFRIAVVALIAYVAYLNLDLSPFSLRAGMPWIAAIAILWMARERWMPWFEDPDGVDGARAAIALLFGAGVCLATGAALFALDLVAVRVPLAAGAFAGFVLLALGHAKRGFHAFAAACAVLAFIAGPSMLLLLREPARARSGVVHGSLGFALKLPRAERNRVPQASPCDPQFLNASYLSLSESIRASVPATALFHITTFDRGFRAFAGRATLPLSDEWTTAVYDGVPAGPLRRETDALWNARGDLAASKALAARLGADYVVACEQGKYALYPLK